jgi:hypothetical protein
MTDFIMANFDAVAGVILALILIIYALITRQWGILRVAAYRFMVDAERIMSTKHGKAKMDAVYAAVWAQIPILFKRFITEEALRKKLQKLYDRARDSLKTETEKDQ